MSEVKQNKKLEAIAKELAKEIKTEKDLSNLTQQLVKMTVEKALQVELDDHLGYYKHALAGRGSGNSRNGYSEKTLKSESGEIRIQTPRDRNGSFEPQLIGKHQTRVTELDDRILTLYAKGMTTRDIAETFEQMDGVNVSHSLISKVTEAVIDQVHAWQNRPLEAVYPIVFF